MQVAHSPEAYFVPRSDAKGKSHPDVVMQLLRRSNAILIAAQGNDELTEEDKEQCMYAAQGAIQQAISVMEMAIS